MIGALLLAAPDASAFCGYYAGHDAQAITNAESIVVIGRLGQKTWITLASDFDGAPEDFALIMPVPAALRMEDVGEVSGDLLQQLDAYSAPRLVTYPETSYCQNDPVTGAALTGSALGCSSYDVSKAYDSANPSEWAELSGAATVEKSFLSGVYEIAVLSADDSSDLVSWMAANDLYLPDAAQKVLQGYIDAGSYFLVARVYLDRDGGDTGTQVDTGTPKDTDTDTGRPKDTGTDTGTPKDTGTDTGARSRAASERHAGWLPPLQLRYLADTVSLPLRLGTLASTGEQEMVIYGLNDNKSGSLAISSLPEAEVPDECLYNGTNEAFSAHYDARFDKAIAAAGGSAWVEEYVWQSVSCDPCTSEPLDDKTVAEFAPLTHAYQAIFTRLHLKYTPEGMPGDLSLYHTGYTNQDQERYILQNSYTAQHYPTCEGEMLPGTEVEACPQAEYDSGGCMLLALPIAGFGFGALRRRRSAR